MSERQRLPRFEKAGHPGAFVVIDHDNADEVVFQHKWAATAEEERDRLNVADGACMECKGVGSVIDDYVYDHPIGADCPRCGGTGREPDSAAAGQQRPHESGS